MIRVLNFANTLPRLPLCAVTGLRSISTCASPLLFRATTVLLGEPLKKKKRIDPNILKQREEKRRRRLEKQIRRLEKVTKQLKPIPEVEIPPKLIKEREERTRHLPPLSEEEIERRKLLEKEWSKYKTKQWLTNVQIMDSIVFSQQKALDELKAESEELYNEAIQIDSSLIPYDAIGPYRTPPIVNYNSPDGEYIDITFKYDGET